MAENRIPLNIAGLSLVITTDEDESYVKDISEEINEDIKGVLEANPGASVTSAGLLCALDYLDECKKATKSANSLRSQIKDYLADAANAKMMFDDERKRTSELDAELQALRSHLTRLASDADTSGALERLKAELSDSAAELSRVRKQAAEQAAQGKTLAEKASAMSDYISSQDREIERLNLAAAEKDKKLAAAAEQLSVLAEQLKKSDERLKDLQSEADRLAGENDALRADCADKDDIIDKLKAVALDKIAAMKNAASAEAAKAPFDAAGEAQPTRPDGADDKKGGEAPSTAPEGAGQRQTLPAQDGAPAAQPETRADDPFPGMKIEQSDLTLGFEGSASSMDAPLEEIPLPDSHLQKLEERVQRAEDDLSRPDADYVFKDDISDILDTREPLDENNLPLDDGFGTPAPGPADAAPRNEGARQPRDGEGHDAGGLGGSRFNETFAPREEKREEKRGLFGRHGRRRDEGRDTPDDSFGGHDDDSAFSQGGDLLMRDPVNLEDIIENLDDEDDMPNLSWIKDIR